ncbi:MAG TPA: hypothetical protein VGL10_04655, partial [Gammaproteobacteria bacterium]
MNRPLISILFVISASSVSAISITEVEGKFVCDGILSEQECVLKYEAALMKSDKSLIQREGKKLLVRLKNGGYFRIDDENQGYNALEIVGLGKYLVLREQYWEGHTWHLLDLETGEILETKGYPLFSPNNQKFVCSQRDLSAGYSPNVLSVYVIKEGKPVSVFSIPPGEDDWGPGNVEWVNDAKIKF